MANLTITLTDTQEKALKYIAYNPEEFVQNFANVRAQHAKKEILDKLYEHCNANGITIATGEDAQVAQAFTLKIVETGKEREDNYIPPSVS